MKRAIVFMLIALLGVFIFDMSSEPLLNSKYLGYLGLAIAWCCILLAVRSLWKMGSTDGKLQ